MNEGPPIMYHGNGFGGPGPMFMVPGMERQARHFPLDVVPAAGASPSPGQGTSRRWHQRRDRNRDNAFAYDSDDSSLSSNTSGERGEAASRSSERSSSSSNSVATHSGSSHGAREWREWRSRRGRDSHARPRRVAPEQRYLNTSYPFQVRYTPEDLLNGSEWDTMSQEMWDKFVKAQQTEDTFRKKMNLWRYLYVTIKSIFPRYGLYVVGSTMTGFGLESSDMDLCLFVRPPDNVEPRTHALLHLNYILGYIKSFDPAAELIPAKVPILKFRDVRNGLQVDLNCNNVVGIRNTDLLYSYSRMDWRVRPLVAVTKLWARAHDINDARQRTLSSYSLTLMVIHFLQCGTSPPVLPGGAARAQPLVAGRAVPQPAAVLRRLSLQQHGGERAHGRPRARRRVSGGARAQERPAPVEAALCRGAVRPDEHGAVGVRPRHVRQGCGGLPRVRVTPRQHATPRARLAAAVTTPRPRPAHKTDRGPASHSLLVFSIYIIYL